MVKFLTFVNGSHLFGAFKHLEVFVNDYETLYRYIFEQAVARWHATFVGPASPLTQHLRTYWYVVDSMDEWDLSSSRTRQYLFERFLEDREVRNRWMAEANRVLTGTGADASRLEQTAFSLCFDDFKAWYDRRLSLLAGMNRFYHAVEASSDFIEIRPSGRWKVDLLHKTITEKGVDVCMAVDMVAYAPHYDVAIIVSGDSEGIPSLEYLKGQGRQVGLVELQKGATPDNRGKAFASQLKISTDFVIPIFESDLVKLGIASKGEGEAFNFRDSEAQ